MHALRVREAEKRNTERGLQGAVLVWALKGVDSSLGVQLFAHITGVCDGSRIRSRFGVPAV